MNRPLILITLSMILGIITANAFNSYMTLLFIGLISSGIILAVKSISLNHRIICTLMAVGFMVTGARYLYTNNSNLKKFDGFYDKEVTIKGIVDSEPDIRDYKVVYIIKTIEISSEGQKKSIKGKVILTTLTKPDAKVYDYGKGVVFKGQLREPAGQRNPAGFNYRNYLARSGISASIFANIDGINELGLESPNPIVNAGIKVRNNIVSIVEKCLPRNQAGLLNGMLIGYRGGLSEDVKENFSDAGLTHIMAVSGMNIAFIVFPMTYVFRRFKIRENISNPIIMCVLIFFVFVTGFSPSILRAVIMAMVILAAQLLRRETDVLTSLAFSAFILIIANPSSIFDIGFQLSFAATISLITLYKKIKNFRCMEALPGFFQDLISVSMAAQLGTIPITAFYFNKVSLISLLSNLLVVPCVEAITILGFGMAILGQFSILAAKLIGYFNNVFLTFILLVTKVSASLPFAVILVITPPLLLVILYYCVLALWMNKDKLPKRRVDSRVYAVAVAVMLVFFSINLFLPRGLEIIFVDVGQGDCALIKSPTGKTMLIDGGGSSTKTSDAFNIGEAVVIPLLLDSGIWRIDAVVATHAHDDHIQGLIPLLEKYNIGMLMIPENSADTFKELVKLAGERGIDTKLCEKGENIILDEKTSLTVLHPKNESRFLNSTLNNESLVLKLRYDKISVLFTGDIEAEVEELMLSEGLKLKSDVLKVSHHGSISSSIESFIKAVSPKAAVISVGRNNFGHPSQYVLERIEAQGAKLFRTDTDGAVIMNTDGKRIRFRTTVK